jgi:hypothetical protein
MSRAILAVEVLIMNKVCEKDGMLETFLKSSKQYQRITSLLRSILYAILLIILIMHDLLSLDHPHRVVDWNDIAFRTESGDWKEVAFRTEAIGVGGANPFSKVIFLVSPLLLAIFRVNFAAVMCLVSSSSSATIKSPGLTRSLSWESFLSECINGPSFDVSMMTPNGPGGA